MHRGLLRFQKTISSILSSLYLEQLGYCAQRVKTSQATIGVRAHFFWGGAEVILPECDVTKKDVISLPTSNVY